VFDGRTPSSRPSDKVTPAGLFEEEWKLPEKEQ